MDAVGCEWWAVRKDTDLLHGTSCSLNDLLHACFVQKTEIRSVGTQAT